MYLKSLICTVAISTLLAPMALARVGVPDLMLSTARLAYDGPETVVILNTPAGNGSSFLEASILGGNLVDATITLTLIDTNTDPIFLFPFTDLWLETEGPGNFTPCTGGTVADQSTNENGNTTWVIPLRAGGWSEGPTVVMVAGAPLASGDLNLGHNSPDINGDGNINLADVTTFALDFYGSDELRSDFNNDGNVNLSDITYLALHWGELCP